MRWMNFGDSSREAEQIFIVPQLRPPEQQKSKIDYSPWVEPLTEVQLLFLMSGNV
jgi:hypothetical protein